ncbi:hypothetical protein EVAR_30553_1 [Eumeta japonica]|uniref:Uncharacterized protein n=1 Tax=Eumeta variegata TaxID=151549 RepID=A0A4C1VRP8_EUMVA|nr:hypothetical protein EVAR_30553_1 [Eumeta japonica]
MQKPFSENTISAVLKVLAPLLTHTHPQIFLKSKRLHLNRPPRWPTAVYGLTTTVIMNAMECPKQTAVNMPCEALNEWSRSRFARSPDRLRCLPVLRQSFEQPSQRRPTLLYMRTRQLDQRLVGASSFINANLFIGRSSRTSAGDASAACPVLLPSPPRPSPSPAPLNLSPLPLLRRGGGERKGVAGSVDKIRCITKIMNVKELKSPRSVVVQVHNVIKCNEFVDDVSKRRL